MTLGGATVIPRAPLRVSLPPTPQVETTRTASIGFCFGGIAVLDLARSGAARSLHTTFSVHGILDSPDLVCNANVCRTLFLCKEVSFDLA